MSKWEITYYDLHGRPIMGEVVDSMDELDEIIAHLVEVYRRDHVSILLDYVGQRILEYPRHRFLLNPIMSWKYVNS